MLEGLSLLLPWNLLLLGGWFSAAPGNLYLSNHWFFISEGRFTIIYWGVFQEWPGVPYPDPLFLLKAQGT